MIQMGKKCEMLQSAPLWFLCLAFSADVEMPKPFSAIPGPKGWPLIGSLLDYTRFGKTINDTPIFIPAVKFCLSRDVHPLKPMMHRHIAISPYFPKIYKFPYFSKIYKFLPLLPQHLRFVLNLRFLFLLILIKMY